MGSPVPLFLLWIPPANSHQPVDGTDGEINWYITLPSNQTNAYFLHVSKWRYLPLYPPTVHWLQTVVHPVEVHHDHPLVGIQFIFSFLLNWYFLVVFTSVLPIVCRSVAEEDLAKLCEGVINSLEECLNYDLQLFEDTCSERARVVLVGSKGGEEQKQAVVPLDSLACLPSGLLLKFSALSILPSHSLRLQGVQQHL